MAMRFCLKSKSKGIFIRYLCKYKLIVHVRMIFYIHSITPFKQAQKHPYIPNDKKKPTQPTHHKKNPPETTPKPNQTTPTNSDNQTPTNLPIHQENPTQPNPKITQKKPIEKILTPLPLPSPSPMKRAKSRGLFRLYIIRSAGCRLVIGRRGRRRNHLWV